MSKTHKFVTSGRGRPTLVSREELAEKAKPKAKKKGKKNAGKKDG